LKYLNLKMSIPRSALPVLWIISTLFPNPWRANRAMKTALKTNIKLTKRTLTLNLLRTMQREKLGTKDAEKIAAELSRNSNTRNSEIVKDVMKWKIKDAENDLKNVKKEYITARNEVREAVPWKSEAGRRFGYLTTRVMNEVWDEGKENNDEKVKKLKEAVKKKNDKVDVYKGVKVSDQALGEETEEEPKAFILGGIETSENEKAALNLPPKMAEYVELDMMNLETEIEKGCTKWRYELMDDAEADDNTDDATQNPEEDEDEGNADQFDKNHKVYDVEKKKLDYTVMKATDLPTVDRLYLPGPIHNQRMEAMIQITKAEMMEDVRAYVAENCGEKGKQKKTCLRAGEQRGIRSLQKKIKNGEIAVFTTDKSDKLCGDSVQNYDEAMKQHVENDEIVTKDEYSKVENEMNGHAAMWGRILNVGAAYEQKTRVKKALLSHESAAPTLRGHRKDHKPVAEGDEEKGPPTRPVVNAKRGAISRVSHLLSQPLSIMADEADEGKLCDNTEEVIEAIEKVNKEAANNKDIIVGSLDVKALFPSLEAERTAAIVRKTVEESEIEIENVDEDELAKYIAINATVVEIEQSGLRDYIHTRRYHKGPKPSMTSREVQGGAVQRNDNNTKWKKPRKKPDTPALRKQLLGWGMEIAVRTIMRNHIYQYHGEHRRQTRGGGIGVELTGAIAKCVMAEWSKSFCLLAGRLGIKLEMYKCYVDDENTIMRSLPMGTRFEDGELVIKNEEIDADRQKPDDERNMKVLKDVADSVEPMIKTTVDFPSNYDDKKMPILDLKVWTEEREDGGKDVQFEFYRKPFASRVVMLASSAAPWQMKRTVLTQEGVRRLMRCRVNLPASRKSEVMTEYMRMLRRSGYNETFRLEVLKSANHAFEKIVDDDKNGVKPMYRNKMWKKKERKQTKQTRMSQWHKQGGFSSVMFVPHTPESRLAKTLRSTMKRIMGGKDGGIKVVEQVGRSVASMLQRADPWKTTGCGRDDCLVCESGEGDCEKESVRYEVFCIDCNNAKVYEGETSSCGYERGKKHIEKYHSRGRTVQEKSFMWKHSQEHHGGRRVKYKMKILNQYLEDPMGRQINEGVFISHTDPERLLNSGGEWQLAHIPRLNPTH